MRTDNSFLKKIVSIIIFFYLLPVSSVFGDEDRWKASGFTEDEKQAWLKEGFTEEDIDWVEMYKKEGIDPSIAIKDKAEWEHAGYERANIPGQWKSCRFTIDDAITWKKAGFTNPFLADNYKKAGFKPMEAKKWSDAFHSSYSAKRWKSLGFHAESAIKWSEKGFSPDEAYEKCEQDGFPPLINGRGCPQK